MKKQLFLLAIVLLSGKLNAQIEIRLDGIGPDISGTIIDIACSPTNQFSSDLYFHFWNYTGSDTQYRITRVKESTNQNGGGICWVEQCIGTPNMDVFTTPNTPSNPAPIILNGTSTTTTGEIAVLRPTISPNTSSSGATLYMYYLTDPNGIYADSIGIRLNYVADVQETPSLSVTIAPNPADNNITIQTTGSNEATVQIVDVLGNVVMKEIFIESSKTIDITDFKNGIYFIRVEAPGAQTINRKIIVRH